MGEEGRQMGTSEGQEHVQDEKPRRARISKKGITRHAFKEITETIGWWFVIVESLFGTYWLVEHWDKIIGH